MSWVDQTLDEYGRALGIEGLAFNEHGVASLQFEEMGALLVERIDDHEARPAVLIYLVNAIDRPSAEVYTRALAACNWDTGSPYLVNASLRQDKYLAFSVRLAEAEFSLPTMERVVALLDEMHQTTREAAAA